jgi:hypothetical protein
MGRVSDMEKDFETFWRSLSENTKAHLMAMHRLDAFEQIYLGLVLDEEPEKIKHAEFMKTLPLEGE